MLKPRGPIGPQIPLADDALAAASAALDRGEAEAARKIVDEAFAERPDDEKVVVLYLALHLARAVRLSAEAREARRREIVARNIGYDEEFVDGADVARAFDDAAAAIDEVLKVEPRNEKALTLQAALAFRRDRAAGRGPALEALRVVAAEHPESRQVLYAIKKIEMPCKRCGDSGFCTRCRGRGSRRILGMESRCEACHGQGICLACGVL